MRLPEGLGGGCGAAGVAADLEDSKIAKGSLEVGAALFVPVWVASLVLEDPKGSDDAIDVVKGSALLEALKGSALVEAKGSDEAVAFEVD